MIRTKRTFACVFAAVVLASSCFDAALAVGDTACAQHTYYDGNTTSGSSGSAFDTANDCNACPDGTTAATTPDGSAATYCEGIKAGYYGTVGVATGASGAHAVVVQCPPGFTSAAINTGTAVTTIDYCFVSSTSFLFSKGGTEDFFHCPSGTMNTVKPAGLVYTYCSSLKPGYVGTAGGTWSHATVTGCASGYYIATVANFAAKSSNSDASGLVCTQVPANKYFTTTTTTPLEVTTAEVPTACPFSGTSAAGSTAVTQCTPDCVTTNSNSGAVANAGTCQCAANYYGTPVDTNGATVLAASAGCCASAAGCSAASTPTASTPTASSKGDCGKPNGGAIAGIVIGSVVGLAAIIAAFAWCCTCCCFRRKRVVRVVQAQPQQAPQVVVVKS